MNADRVEIAECIAFDPDELNVVGQTYFWADWNYRDMFASIVARRKDVFATQASGFDHNTNEQQTALISTKNGITAAWVLWNELRT